MDKRRIFSWNHCVREKAPVISLEWGIGSLHKVWDIMLESIRKQRWGKVKYFQAFKNLMLTILSTYNHFYIKYENSSQYKVICKELKWWVYKITENTWGSRASPLFFFIARKCHTMNNTFLQAISHEIHHKISFSGKTDCLSNYSYWGCTLWWRSLGFSQRSRHSRPCMSCPSDTRCFQLIWRMGHFLWIL